MDVSEDGKIGSLWFTNGQKTTINIQLKEHIGFLWKTSSRGAHTSIYKDIYAYFCVETFDLIKSVAHIDPSEQVAWYNLLAKWTSVISKNKYDVGLTDISYKIRLSKWNPVSGYVPRMTPAMVNVVNEELEKLKVADFIKPSISPFLSPMVCVKKMTGRCGYVLISGWSTKIN